MLHEFAFTPAIFDEESHVDKEAWGEQLRELTAAIFPRTSVWPVVISDLYTGSWSSHIVPYVENIADHRARKFCQGLLTNMQRMLVVRPNCGEWPNDDDAAWCREAVATHAVEPIDRIVTVRKTKNSTADDFSIVRCIDEVEDGGFWRDINSDASPRMVVSEQVQLLRKLCLHSEWVALINPYCTSSEMEFTVQLIDLAMRRNTEFGKLTIEIHANEPDDRDSVERARKQQNVTYDMVRRITPKVTTGNTVELYFWPKLLDRIIVAGNYTKQSGGIKRKSPRWGVSMSHIAHGNEPNAAPTEWKLLRRDALDRWFRQFIAENAKSKPNPTTVDSAE
ncbi:MAG: hypothetical protein JNL67_07215 [Planctomycetaceae bacterium]|nr:hypothetical protein [Planctomycetaceae bacterium]